jgi:asparaginyl-tRNA synthetase
MMLSETRHMLSRLLTTSSAFSPTIRQLLALPTSNSPGIVVNGLVQSVRRQKRVAFAVINDGSSSSGMQVVFNDPTLAKRWAGHWHFLERVLTKAYQSLTTGTSVRLTGKLVKSIGAEQEKELEVDSVQVLGECDPAVRIFGL